MNKGGRLTQAESDRLHESILDTAEELFLARGYGATSMDAVAAASGASKKTIYSRYGSKKDLFLAVNERTLIQCFHPVHVTEGSFEDKLYFVSLELLRNLLNPKLVKIYGIVVGEARRHPEMAKYTHGIRNFPALNAFNALLHAGFDTGVLHSEDPDLAIELFTSMVLMSPLNWAVLGVKILTPQEEEDWARLSVQIFLKAHILPPPPPVQQRSSKAR